LLLLWKDGVVLQKKLKANCKPNDKIRPYKEIFLMFPQPSINLAGLAARATIIQCAAKRWLKEYFRYIQKVFLPAGWTKWAKDKRENPEIKPGTIWITLLMGFTFQVKSLEELERRAKAALRSLCE